MGSIIINLICMDWTLHIFKLYHIFHIHSFQHFLTWVLLEHWLYSHTVLIFRLESTRHVKFDKRWSRRSCHSSSRQWWWSRPNILRGTAAQLFLLQFRAVDFEQKQSNFGVCLVFDFWLELGLDGGSSYVFFWFTVFLIFLCRRLCCNKYINYYYLHISCPCFLFANCSTITFHLIKLCRSWIRWMWTRHEMKELRSPSWRTGWPVDVSVSG